jgi:hypothetical protein
MCFRLGTLHKHKKMLDSTRECNSQVINNIGDSPIQKHYGHEGTLGNEWNHAQALISNIWMECFKKELYK